MYSAAQRRAPPGHGTSRDRRRMVVFGAGAIDRDGCWTIVEVDDDPGTVEPSVGASPVNLGTGDDKDFCQQVEVIVGDDARGSDGAHQALGDRHPARVSNEQHRRRDGGCRASFVGPHEIVQRNGVLSFERRGRTKHEGSV